MGGRTGGLDWGSDEVAGKISQVSLRFADMSSDVDVVHSTCPSLGKVNFGLDKVTSQSITVTAEAASHHNVMTSNCRDVNTLHCSC